MWWLIFIVYLITLRFAKVLSKTHFWVCLWEVFQRKITKGKKQSWLCAATPSNPGTDRIKVKRARSHQQRHPGSVSWPLRWTALFCQALPLLISKRHGYGTADWSLNQSLTCSSQLFVAGTGDLDHSPQEETVNLILLILCKLATEGLGVLNNVCEGALTCRKKFQGLGIPYFPGKTASMYQATMPYRKAVNKNIPIIWAKVKSSSAFIFVAMLYHWAPCPETKWKTVISDVPQWLRQTCMSSGSQINTRKTRNVKHVVLTLQRSRYITYFSPKKLGMEMVNSMVPCALSLWLAHTGSLRPLSWDC